MHLPDAARLRLISFVLAVLIGGGVVWLLFGTDLDAVREIIDAAGVCAPLAFMALHVLLTLVPVSKNVLALAAGALFGLTAGIALSWAGSLVSAAVTFAIARRIGRPAVAQMTGYRLQRVEGVLDDEGFNAVVMARLTPVLPFTIVNYGAGVSSMAWRPYLLGSAIGVLPGSVGYAALGASSGRAISTYVGAGIVGALVFLGALLSARRHTGRRRGA